MALAVSNRLLPILVGILLVVTVMVVMKSCSDEESHTYLLDAVPQAPKADADTPADTIKTLTANVRAMKVEVVALRRESASLKQQNSTLLNTGRQIEDTVTDRMRTVLRKREQEQETRRLKDVSVVEALTARVERLNQSLSDKRVYTSSTTGATDIPIGLGLDGLGGKLDTSLIWVEPLEAMQTLPDKTQNLFNRLGRSSKNALNVAGTEAGKMVSRTNMVKQSTPVYTIPRNATLIGSITMTAMVGRIPIQGQVHDPMPFKIITGKENLAANGLTIPGVQGMIWSGTTIGDWTLSCVSGQLESVTFVFEDGTIETLSSDDDSLKSANASTNKPLAWISDARGIPCISGTRKTNAPTILAQRMGAMAVEAAALAAAQSETTTLVSDTGTASSLVTGNTGQFILGKSLSGGSRELAQWLRERQAQNFDAVFVPAGVEIAIHLNRELPIDFHHNGRKLYHGNPNQKNHRTRLD